MVFNEEVLYLHVPKTAGKSIALALVQTLRRPIHCIVPPGTQAILEENCDLDGVTIERGSGHEGLHAGTMALEANGISPASLRTVVVGIRRPYDLMVSNYHFMRQRYAKNVGRENFEIANRSTFEDFAAESVFASLDRYFSIAGHEPQRLDVLRYESLQSDFDRLLSFLGYEPVLLPHLNSSTHGHYSEHLTPKAEQAIYDKFRYLFEAGYYEREAPVVA